MTFKCIEFGDKEFATKEAMFDSLLKHEQDIIKLKKAAIQKSHEKGQPSVFALKQSSEVKAAFDMKEGYFYPVINTTNYKDSHGDVHFPGIWDRSLKAQKGNIFYVLDHSLSIDKVVAWPNDVEAFVKTVPWSFVGKDYPGETQALIYGIDKRSIANDYAKSIIADKKPVQNSIRMSYVKIFLGVNDSRPDFKEQKSYYDKRISEIANKEVAEADGFFWGIEEAKIEKEGSMVLFGSNDATPIQYSEPAESTSEKTEESSKDTQPNKSYYSHFI